MAKAKRKMVTPKEYAKKIGVPYQTVMSWLRRNLLPGADKTVLPSGGWYYLVPIDTPKPELKRGPKSKKTHKSKAGNQ
jgi:hypothetical protein